MTGEKMADWLTPEQQLTEVGRIGDYGHGSYVSPCNDCGRRFIGDKRARQCLRCAVNGAILSQAREIAELREALTSIDGEAVTKEPPAEPTVGPPRGWREEMADYVHEIVLEAFQEGASRGRWEAANIARSALSAEQEGGV